MPPTRILIICFWVFIGGMLFWQFYNYNNAIEQAPAPEQHFYFYNTNTSSNPSAPKPIDGPDVRQVSCTVALNQPGVGSFTSKVTLKNTGSAKAVDIQVMVRPFRGTSRGDVDNPSSGPSSGPIPDSDPVAQLGQWVSFPDLAPGESNTQTAVFIGQRGLNPGDNPNPQIVFHAEKPKQ